MSAVAPLQNAAAKPQQSSPLGRGGMLLQRQCACGSATPSLTGVCDECGSGKRLQAKLTIGASNDPLEQEADRLADQVLAAPLNSAVSGARPRIQRYAGQATGGTDTAPASVYRVLASSGRPLEPALKQDMEQRFGHDFSRVRVHSGGAAEQSARDLNAHAYTVGNNVVFGAGQFAPETHGGRRLLAHELTHVVQQSADTENEILPRIPTSNLGENESDTVSPLMETTRPRPESIRTRVSPVVARKGSSEEIGAKHFEARLKRMEKLLSYGLFDWAITDAEAIEAFQLLKAMSGPERAKALKVIRLDRLINNLPEKYQTELAKIVAESGGEQTIQTQVQKILTYDFFDLIGFASESEAKQALALLEALPEDQRDRVLDRIPSDKRRRLFDALPPQGKARFLQMWKEKEERKFERQHEMFRKIVRGEKFLMRVLLKDTKEPLEAFAPEGTAVAVNEDGEVYYAPFEAFVSVAGRTREEAESRLTGELTDKAKVPLLVELKPRPPGFTEDYFEAAPPPKRALAAVPTAVSKPAPKPDPLFDRQQEFRAMIVQEVHRLQEQYKLLQKSPKDERFRKDYEQDQDAFHRFYEWFDKNENSPFLLKFNPPALLGQFRVDATMRSVKETVAKKIREESEAKAYSPEMQQVRIKKMDEFLNLAMSVRGESARRFPYRIPVASEGVDILVTGDPARQFVLNQIADELMGWSREHSSDDNYATVDPRDILLYVLKSGYNDALRATDKEPLKSEVIDRHELVWGKVLESFGKTLATGLVVIAIVGAAVGLGLPGAIALIILGAVAAIAAGIKYLERRKEIEEKGYEVPVPITAVNAAGDAIGVSQLIEGITGERLGINERLKSAERSEKLGEGGGGVALLLLGSRAFRFGQGVGRTVRLSSPPAVPETLEGVPLKDLGGEYENVRFPTKPVQNPTPGPVEAQARAALPEHLRVGFDRWVAGMRSRNPQVDVDGVLRKMTQEKIEAISKKPAEDYHNHLAKAEQTTKAQAAAKPRSAGDPLRPKLKHTYWKDGVTIQYEKADPLTTDVGKVEFEHAKLIQTRTGEPVHLFGDTPSGKTYPGIDGTIGEPPRPLQLKNLADPSYLKVHASDAFEAAAKHGYDKVEVHLRVKDSTIAEIKAAWEGKPGHPRGAEIGWETKLSMARAKLPLARLVIEGKDGVWIVEAPPTSPNLPGVLVPSSGGKPDEKPAGSIK